MEREGSLIYVLMLCLYGNVLKSNKGNSEAMGKGVMAILYHYSSTEEYPQYQHRPESETSWSKFQVDKYNWGNTYRPVKDPILNTAKVVILPAYEKLGNQKFLECCKNKCHLNQMKPIIMFFGVLHLKILIVQHKSLN